MDAVTTAAKLDLCLSGAGRQVLLTEIDLFRNLGGGQTVSRRLMALRPQDRFHYFIRNEKPDAPRPPNAVAIPFMPKYRAVRDDLPHEQAHLLWAYQDARNLAFSVAQHLPGHSFDVVDVPDYTQHGIFIRAALEAEGLHCDIVALALHGTLSSAWAGGWPAPGHPAQLDEMQIREELQCRAADARYTISAAYAREWQAKAPLPINMVNPLSIVAAGDPTPGTPRAGPPYFVFVGRREKWKGPDLFLDLAWCVDPNLYRRLLVHWAGRIQSYWARFGIPSWQAWRGCAACSRRSWAAWDGSRCSACWPSAPCCFCRRATIRSTSSRSRLWRAAVRR